MQRIGGKDMTWWRLPVPDGDRGRAVGTLLSALLETGYCDLVLTPQVSGKGDAVVSSLVADPARLAALAPDWPAMPVSSASLLSGVAGKEDSPRVAAVLRSCEAKALVELAKLKQVVLDRVVVIGVDCVGTVHPRDLRGLLVDPGPEAVAAAWRQSLGEGTRGTEGIGPVRPACETCPEPEVKMCGIRLGLIGSPGDAVLVELPEDLAGLAGSLGMTEASPTELEHRSRLVKSLGEAGASRRAEELARRSDSSVQSLLSDLAGCIRCLNCRRACPICYCRECAFETMLFEHGPEQYRAWAERKGAVRLPADISLFHLTRMNHVGASCVGCGLCEMACPVGIDLFGMFLAASADIQRLFDYEPGSDPDAPLPYTTFQEAELEPR